MKNMFLAEPNQQGVKGRGQEVQTSFSHNPLPTS